MTQPTNDPPDAPRDLAGVAMSRIDDLVDALHDKVIRPILLLGRWVAFSFIVVFSAMVLAVALCVALLRLLDVYAFSAHQWASWAVLGGLSLAAGLVVWRFRRAAPSGSAG